MATLGINQRIFLEALCAQTPDTFMTGSWDVFATERIGISLAKRGLVDGPTTRPEYEYAQHTINAAGRQWVHDNIDPVAGRRWVLTGVELPQDEYEKHFTARVARTRGEYGNAVRLHESSLDG